MADELEGTPPVEPEETPPVEPAVEPAPAVAPAAAPAPVFAQLSDDALGRIGTAVAQGIVGASQALRPAPAIPTIEDVTDDEINAAVQRGENVAHLVRKMAHASTAREKRALEERITQLEAQGARAIGTLVRQSLIARPYYKDYRAEIDATLANLAPAQAADPATVEWVYDKIVGSHTSEIVEREKQAALRQAREAAPAQPAGSASGRATGAPEIRAEDVLSREELLAAKDMGGIDHVASMLGYADTQAFLKSRQPEVQ